MTKINIVFNIDENFIQHCAATISSIIMHCDEQIVFYIVQNGLGKEGKEALSTLVKGTQHSMEFVQMDNSVIDKLPVNGNTVSDQITASAYFRLFLPALLPCDIDKVLYLDADTIVNTDISMLYNTNISGYAVAGVWDKETNQQANKKRCGIPDKFKYVNSGVLLLNLKFLREIRFTEMVLEYLQKNIDRILYHDQDVLNALLYAKMLYLPYKWDMMDCYLYKSPICAEDRIDEVIEAQQHPSIIHFAGFYKPWNKECRNPYRHLYGEALSHTIWRGWKKTRKTKEIIPTLKLYAKRILKGNPYFK